MTTTNTDFVNLRLPASAYRKSLSMLDVIEHALAKSGGPDTFQGEVARGLVAFEAFLAEGEKRGSGELPDDYEAPLGEVTKQVGDLFKAKLKRWLLATLVGAAIPVDDVQAATAGECDYAADEPSKGDLHGEDPFLKGIRERDQG